MQVLVDLQLPELGLGQQRALCPLPRRLSGIMSECQKLIISQADGRDSDISMMPGPFRISQEVYVPQLENGSLHYTIMEIIAASDADSGWAVKDLPSQPFPTATGPSAVSCTAMDGLDTQRAPKVGIQGQAGAVSWTGTSVHLD